MRVEVHNPALYGPGAQGFFIFRHLELDLGALAWRKRERHFVPSRRFNCRVGTGGGRLVVGLPFASLTYPVDLITQLLPGLDFPKLADC